MRGPDTDDQKDTHVSVRLDAETVSYLDTVGEAWGFTRPDGSVNRSKTLRTIIKTHNGVLYGNFFGIVNNDNLASEWGSLGHTLAAANESNRGVPADAQDIRLADVLEPIPLLVSAAETELQEVDGEHGRE